MAPVPASAGLLHDCLRQQNQVFTEFDFGRQFRARHVSQSCFAIPGAGPTAVDFRASTPYDVHDMISMGKPLRFRRLQPGYVIYSLGRDRQDDGGKERPEQGPVSNYDETFMVDR